MKTQKTFLSISIFFISLFGFSQQIGNGYASEINNFSVPLTSGAYNSNGSVITGITPDISSVWQHLFTIRHPNSQTNHQLQIASSFTTNDRLFFRKIAADLNPANPAWFEIATRGINTFNGNQTVIGNIITGNVNGLEGSLFLGNSSHGIKRGVNNVEMYTNGTDGNLLFSTFLNQEKMRIQANGKVGIGTLNPDELLTVNGTIHSKEIIVDTAIPPDYVFQKYYTGASSLKADYIMPTLAEIENFTKKNNHLPNVPSAQEMQQKGMQLGEMSNILLQKVEELTLYAIEQNKKIMSQQEELEQLKTENENYKLLAERLAAVEKELKK